MLHFHELALVSMYSLYPNTLETKPPPFPILAHAHMVGPAHKDAGQLGSSCRC